MALEGVQPPPDCHDYFVFLVPWGDKLRELRNIKQQSRAGGSDQMQLRFSGLATR